MDDRGGRARPAERPAARFVASVPVLVRACRETDLQALEWFGLFREHRTIIERTFAQAERGEQLMWVAEAGGFPAGQIWAERATARLWAARVFPALQCCGIGTRLLEVAEEALAAEGHRRFALAVETGNRRGLAFWGRRGYRRAGRTTERWSYVAPDGRTVELVSELDLLEKDLDREADDVADGAAHDAGDPVDHR